MWNYLNDHLFDFFFLYGYLAMIRTFNPGTMQSFLGITYIHYN